MIIDTLAMIATMSCKVSWLSLWQGNSKLKLMAFEEEELLKCANERIPWHEKLEGEEAIQNRVHE